MSWVDGTDSSNVSPRSRRQICVLPTRPSAQGRSTCCASRKRDCPYRSNLTSSYYQCWVLATEKNVVERGLAGADELEAGHALRAGKPLKRKLTADVVEQGMTRGSFFLQPQAPARFKLGDRVRTKNIHPPTHTRLPRYARGRFGVVELVHGCHFRTRSQSTRATIRNGSTPLCSTANCGARTPTPRSRSPSTRSSPISIRRDTSFVDDTVRHAAEAGPIVWSNLFF